MQFGEINSTQNATRFSMLKDRPSPPISPRAPAAAQIPSNANDGQLVFVSPSTRSARALLRGSNRSSSSNNIVPAPTTITATPEASPPHLPWYRRVLPGKRAYLSYLTVGVIYGDIGTSPLYTFSSVFTTPPETEGEVIGALSLMLYAILLVFMIKYVVFMLFADDHGEGGTFALNTLLSRSLKTKYGSRYPKWDACFSFLAVLGVSAIFADGVLTPAITVLGAVQGLLIAAPGALSTDDVAGISCAILICFFLLQSLGTQKIAFLFSPVLVVWFLALAGIGIYNITLAPQVLQAFNPQHAAMFLAQGFEPGWSTLGAVFLTLTGSEALFADLGHFDVPSIRKSALLLVIPSLVLCYCGQAAAIVANPEIVSNTFYLSTPSAVFYPMLVLATLAAIIASQSMVTATFSIASQAINLDYFPRLTIVRSNSKRLGEVYIPQVNYFLMIVVLAVVGGFRSSTTLGYAYGITVSSAFLISSILYAACVVIHFDRHWTLAVLFLLVFGFIDANFLAANLLKFPLGGWFSVVLMFVLSMALFVWKWGRFKMLFEQDKMRVLFPDLAPGLEDDEQSQSLIPVKEMDDDRNKLMICLSGKVDSAPASLIHFFRRVHVRPKFLVLLTVNVVNVGFVDTEFRIEPIPGLVDVFHVAVYHGYAECAPTMQTIAGRVIREICLPPELNVFPPTPDSTLMKELDPTFLLGRDFVVAKSESRLPRRALVSLFQFLLQVSTSPVSNLHIPADSTLEVGVQIKI